MGIYQRVFYVFVPIWVVAQLLTTIWLLRAKPSKVVLDKYPRKVRLLLQFTFWKKWKHYVHKEDLKLIERYQFRLMIWQLSFALPFSMLMFVFILISVVWQ